MVGLTLDFNRKRVKITRKDQTHIGINEEIKEQIREQSLTGETDAETITRTFENADLLYQLTSKLVDAFEESTENLSKIILTLPDKVQELFTIIKGNSKNETED